MGGGLNRGGWEQVRGRAGAAPPGPLRRVSWGLGKSLVAEPLGQGVPPVAEGGWQVWSFGLPALGGILACSSRSFPARLPTVAEP